MFKDKVLLASGSPRRHEIIRYFFSNVGILKVNLDEPRWGKEFSSTDAYLSFCCEKKWEAALLALSEKKSSTDDEKSEKTKRQAEKVSETYSMLVADTIVVLGEGKRAEVLGKPVSKKEAQFMLRKLSGQKHSVFTAFRLGAFVPNDTPRLFYTQVETKVSFYKLSAAEIETYVNSGQPMDKAGAYGFQDGALRFVSRLEGSYLNVMGLPGLELVSAGKSLGLK